MGGSRATCRVCEGLCAVRRGHLPCGRKEKMGSLVL